MIWFRLFVQNLNGPVKNKYLCFFCKISNPFVSAHFIKIIFDRLSNHQKTVTNSAMAGTPTKIGSQICDASLSMRALCCLTTKLSDRRRKRPVGCNSRGQIT